MGVNSPSAVPFTARTKEGNEYKPMNTNCAVAGLLGSSSAAAPFVFTKDVSFWDDVSRFINSGEVKNLTKAQKIGAGTAFALTFAAATILFCKVGDSIINHFRAKKADKKAVEQNQQEPRTVAVG
ncbi:MAG: hypothetical protein PHC64_01990 [Candidatus Gastranaerophilales bacterium]|nr:hypothetical protein [Candidatus Gastranaerophilales bacterium]